MGSHGFRMLDNTFKTTEKSNSFSSEDWKKKLNEIKIQIQRDVKLESMKDDNTKTSLDL